MKILVVQLTRMGDIAQSSGLINALNRHYKGAQIDILCDDHNKDICKSMDVVSKVHSIGLGRLNITQDWLELAKCLESVKNENYDLIYNLNSSKISAIISNYISNGRSQIFGHSYDSLNNNINSSPWWTLIKCFLVNRRYAPVNIVEAFRYTLLEGDKSLLFVFPSKSLLQTQIEKGSIGIIIGAGSQKRFYPSVYFYELISKLIGHGYGPIYLLGSKKEIPASMVLQKKVDSKSLVNLVGSTTTLDLLTLLPSLDLTIGVDTGPLHLASSLKRKTLGLYFGPAWFLETGPFGENNWVIQSLFECGPCGEAQRCHKPECRLSIKPDLVFETAKAAMEGEEIRGRSCCIIARTKGYKEGFFYESVGDQESFLEQDILELTKLYRAIISNTFDIPLSYPKLCITKKHIYELDKFASYLQIGQVPKYSTKLISPFIMWLCHMYNGNSFYLNKLSEAIYATLGADHE